MIRWFPAALALTLFGCAAQEKPEPPRASGAIFFHADGTSIAHWSAARLASVGPDGGLAWDRLPHVGVYRGHMLDSVAATSHGGATVHAHGERVPMNSYGIPKGEGNPSVLHQALEAGLGTALINSGTITEPGTGVFAVHADSRKKHALLAEGILESGVDVLLGGGERWFLPEGVEGRHGPGRRRDGVNLVERARELGYAVVYDAEELAAVPPDTTRLLGLFAAHHTFNAKSEEALREAREPLFKEGAPNVAQMLDVALSILERKGQPFLVVLEEEGSDDFGNANNASGVIEALLRADAAIALARERDPDIFVVSAADSDAGGMAVLGRSFVGFGDEEKPLPTHTERGAPIDGRDGAGTLPFLAAPDAQGVRLPFAISWSTGHDVAGSVVVRAAGPGAEAVRGSVPNTRIAGLLREALGLAANDERSAP